MLQVTQYQKTGELRVEELPEPLLPRGGVLVRNTCSLISAGTERTSVETARASMVGKARSRPDLVRQVRENVQREGLLATYRKVQTRLDNVKELGYSSAGVVIESDVDGIAPGDRVACAGTAYHAEVVAVHKHLVARIPDQVGEDAAASVALCAIALQGVRQADVGLGESVAVIGLGLVGLITVQLLKAQGCRVIGLDVSTSNFDLARALGCDDCVTSDADAVAAVESFTRGLGTDAVILAASTRSNQPVELALEFARPRSTVVVVGAVGMEIPRSPFYEKELVLTISCSYGPGRYDPLYEQAGIDYPVGHVRWTENRNMQAALDLMARGQLDTTALVTHRFPIERATEAYDLITGKTTERYLGILLDFPERPVEVRRRVEIRSGPLTEGADPIVAGFVGAGNFATSYLLPHLVKKNVSLAGVATTRPVSAKSVGDKFGFAFCTMDPAEVVADESVNTMFVATRHDTHARFATEALQRGHSVFVEKPLAVTKDELSAVEAAARAASLNGQYLAVGFNRRFSAPLRQMAAFFADRRAPMFISYRVNAGRVPRDAWVHAEAQGGRMIGEGCHFIDTFAFLIGERPVQVMAAATWTENVETVGEDTATVTVSYADGSLATLAYVANGSDRVPKEHCEVSAEGKTAVLSNFKRLDLYTQGSATKRSYNGGKGHDEELAHFLDVVGGRAQPEFSVDELVETTLVTFAAVESMRTRTAVAL